MVRHQANRHALEIARDIRQFMVDSDQFISLSRRINLTHIMLKLESFAAGR